MSSLPVSADGRRGLVGIADEELVIKAEEARTGFRAGEVVVRLADVVVECVEEDELDVEIEEPLDMKNIPLLKGFSDCPLLALVISKCMMSEEGSSALVPAAQA